jgi:hypothetical protein
MRIHLLVVSATLALTASCGDKPRAAATGKADTTAKADAEPSQYLYVWTGDSAEKQSDFLAVIDATPSSPNYGALVRTVRVGVAGSHPHHTEEVVAANGHLLANGFHAGRTWLFDASVPAEPKLLAMFDDIAGFSHPHSYVRVKNGRVLMTFQYAADSTTRSNTGTGQVMAMGGGHKTGGLVEMDENGASIRSASAADPSISDKRIYPYSVLPIASLDRAVSTTTDMDDKNLKATGEWVQLWRLSDLKLLRSIALKPGPRGDENKFTGEPRLLPDGKSVYVHTFNCGLYLLRGVESDAPTSMFVHSFKGKNCGVPLLIGHFWIQTVPDAHALVTLDVTDPEHPREVSTLDVGADEQPHWIARDTAGKRIVMNTGGAGTGNRVFILTFDPTTGALAMDDRFHDPGMSRPGIRFSHRSWPPGSVSTAIPHGAVFSR